MSKVIKTSDFYGNQYDVPAEQLIWRVSAYSIVIKDGKILLAKQRKAYELPGGGVDFGETPEEAAIRETKEETGVEAANPRLVTAVQTFFAYKDFGGKMIHAQSLLLYFICDFVGGDLSTDGFDEYERLVAEMPEWVPLERLDGIKAGTTVDWHDVVREALDRLR